MRYLIDGHNLIGHCKTIALGDPDDEARLVDLLHRWVLRNSRHQITVIFDGGVYGHPLTLERPGVQVQFAHSPSDADARLIAQLARSAGSSNMRLVTSDRAVARAAIGLGIEVVPSDRFAAALETPRVAKQRAPKRQRIEPKLSRAEVDDWLKLFGEDEES